MNISLWILDGLVMLIFFVAWAESSTDPKFRLTPFRLLRAFSIPCAVIWLLHLGAARDWFEAISQAVPAFPKHWFLELVVAPIVGAFAAILSLFLFVWSIFGLLFLISAQFFIWSDLWQERKL